MVLLSFYSLEKQSNVKRGRSPYCKHYNIHMRVSMYTVNLFDVQTIRIKEKVKMFAGISHLTMMKKQKKR
jgi:hypothetical protein